MPPILNPILPGFNPDPSILRVGNVYYIATSTFEWYPGVQIHTSSDLANWTLCCRPLTRASQLDMRGNPDSAGIWAPCLSYTNSTFYLVYTDVKRKDGSFRDSHNYIVTAPSITGPWSDPTHVNSSGFDPSLFHDEEAGKSYFVNMLWSHRFTGPSMFSGIRLQEYDLGLAKLVGPSKTIFKGSPLGLVEGPHMYRRGGWYYLLVAEGGTSHDHAMGLARSKNVWGPYEPHPDVHILSSKDAPFAALTRAGHGDVVDTPDGKTYVVHLAGRPTSTLRRCVLGRETSIQEAYWAEDGWLYVKNGPAPSLRVDVPGVRDDTDYWAPKRYSFAPSSGLPQDFQWLRTPDPDRLFRLTDSGALVLTGRESIGSWFEQSLVARRQTHFSYLAETVVSSFSPSDERQYAGIAAYYCRFNFHYLTVTANEDGGREVLIMSSDVSFPHGNITIPCPAVAIPQQGSVRLAVSVRGRKLQFSYALEGASDLTDVGPALEASILCDECGGHRNEGSFTGAFVGMACSDLNGTAMEATFDYFEYTPVRDPSDRYEI